jgi:hypothetical protein
MKIGTASGGGKSNVVTGAVVQGQGGMLNAQKVNIGNN